MSKCKGCKAAIIWARDVKSKRNCPLDAEPSRDGNVQLDKQTRECETLGGMTLAEARMKGATLYVNHFVTCPAQQQFRKRA
jgi:hypothetical protein